MVSWCQNVCYDVKKFVMKSKTRHDVKKSKICKTKLSLSQKHFMTSKNSLWCQKDVMTSISLSWCQNISWRQIVRYDIKKFVMMSTTFYDDKKLVIASTKGLSWRQKFVMTSKVCHEVKNCYDVNDIKNVSWRKEHTMALQSSSWLQKVRHDVQSMSNLPWRQNVRHDVKRCCIRYDIWLHQKFVMMSWTRHDVKTLVITLKNIS